MTSFTMFLLTLTVSSVMSGDIQGSVNWVNENMSPVDDQWSCGSCYGFATSALIEWKASNVTGKLIKLSRQFIVDCMGYDGCAGGTSSDGFKYLMANQYQPYAADYEYLGFYSADHCAKYGAEDKSLRNALADVWVFNYDRVSNMDWSGTEEALMQEGPVVVTGYISKTFMSYYAPTDGTDPYTDNTCTTDPNSHVMLLTGYNYNNGDPYITIRNSYSEYWGDEGYINYATNNANFDCRFANNAYTVHLGKRKELEYKIGTGRLNYYDAQAYCQGFDETTGRTGWDLAIVPTRMHNMEVFDMFTAKYGTDKKSNDLFNYFWIGIDTAKSSFTWVDGSDIIFDNWDYGQKFNYKFAAMYKYNTDYEIEEARGKWTTLAKSKELRFMCSRYRYETCERITHTKVNNAFSFTMYNSSNEETLEIEEGTVGVFTCMDGYTLYGDSVTCSNGQWSAMPTCAMAAPTCYKMDKSEIENSKKLNYNSEDIDENGQIMDGAEVRIVCQSTYWVTYWESSYKRMICSNGTWTNIPTCEQACSKFSVSQIPNAGRVAYLDEDLNSYGRVVIGGTGRVFCNKTYFVTYADDAPVKRIICGEGGVWENIPKCEQRHGSRIRRSVNKIR